MAKVKKATGVTGERNAKGGKSAKPKTDEKRPRSKSKSKAKTTRTAAKAPQRRPKAKTAKTPHKTTSKTGTRGSRTAVASGVKGKRAAKSALGKSAKGRLSLVRGRAVTSNTPVVTVAVRELDPLRKCGPNTTVQFLYRVDESVDGRRTAHLVFFDRHGWYCEHGRTCPAVGHAKKYNGQIARVS